MNGFQSKLLVAVAAAAVLSGVSGLFVAGGTWADVDALKGAQPGIEARLGEVEQGLAGLKSATDERARRDEEFRTEQRQQLTAIDGKLGILLGGGR